VLPAWENPLSVPAPNHSVTLTLNACRTDASFLHKTLPHIVQALHYPFLERLVAYDPGNIAGKFLHRMQGEDDHMRRVLAALLASNVIDRIDDVPWSDGEQQRILEKYFGSANVAGKDVNGTPVYQYLYALDRCAGDYILHVDSDMLFHFDPHSRWIYEAVEMMQQNPRVVIATPAGGPPQAKNFLERLLGSPPAKPSSPAWSPAETVSTRYFLLHRRRFEQELLPLLQRKPAEALEDSITFTLQCKGYFRWTVRGGTDWAIHPYDHGPNFLRHLDDLIWAVENGVYPFRRRGCRWDLNTEGSDIRPWLAAIRKARSRPSSNR
jgi:hypothetical protein